MKHPCHLETERLILDPLQETDKADYFANISHDRRVLETFVCRYAETLEDFDFSSYLANDSLTAIRLKQTGRLIGIILAFDEQDGTCEIGYGIGSNYWGKGYATEAARRFIGYCFDELGVQTVTASFFTGNDASRRVMEKCGMHYLRFSPKELTYLGAERDLTYYAVSKRPRVVLLNGPSSSGKSSLAAALRELIAVKRNERYAVVSIDDHLHMAADEAIYEDDVFAVNAALCGAAQAALDGAPGVIVDHVVTSERIFRACKEQLGPRGLFLVRVTCPLPVLRSREAARQNRCPGSAEASMQCLFPKDGYDLTVDTQQASPVDGAQAVYDALFRVDFEHKEDTP